MIAKSSFRPVRMPDRLSRIYICFALDPLRRQLERPGQDQGQREASNNENYQ